MFATVLSKAALAQGRRTEDLFRAGEQLLRSGDLDGAEHAFRAGLQKDASNAGAHVNLGVIYMRRKHWPQALKEFHRAEVLAPEVAGIHWNIGLAQYRQNNFTDAIAPLQKAVRLQPDAQQSTYLLGLCYFLTERYDEAVQRLEPLWAGQLNNVQYLYALGIAAGEAHRTDLEQQAMVRLRATGGDSAEMHLLRGKALLARDQPGEALAELEQAAHPEPSPSFCLFLFGGNPA